MNDYDVIIIGTGAGGGALAQRIAPSGKRILITGAYVSKLTTIAASAAGDLIASYQIGYGITAFGVTRESSAPI